jgi:hypothetical protein
VNTGDWALCVVCFTWFCVVFSLVVWEAKRDLRQRRAEREELEDAPY